MSFRTLESVLQPDGRLSLPQSELPSRPVRVMVTLLDNDEDANSSNSATTTPAVRL